MTAKNYVTVERVRRLRVDVADLARVIEITSIEDHKCRGWSRPVAKIDRDYGGIGEHEVAPLATALTEAFALFTKEFGP